MRKRICKKSIVAALLSLITALPLLAEWVSTRLDDAEFSARIVLDPKEVKSLLGTDLERDYVLVELKVRPLFNSMVNLGRDNFTLRSRRNNDRSAAMAPEQIAGTSVLVLGSRRTTTSSGIFSQENDGVILGAPGTGTRPRRVGGQDRSLGSGTSSSEELTVKSEKREATSLLGRLKQLELPVGETQGIASGYLYFQVSAKHKLKHYELAYEGNVGDFNLKFK